MIMKNKLQVVTKHTLSQIMLRSCGIKLLLETVFDDDFNELDYSNAENNQHGQQRQFEVILND